MLLVLGVLVGCSSTSIEDLENELSSCEFECTSIEVELDKLYDIQYRDAVDLNKWERCQRIYVSFGIPTYSNHDHRRGQRHSPWQIREDYWLNKCHMLVKD